MFWLFPTSAILFYIDYIICIHLLFLDIFKVFNLNIFVKEQIECNAGSPPPSAALARVTLTNRERNRVLFAAKYVID